jgi:hypothetical protein
MVEYELRKEHGLVISGKASFLEQILEEEEEENEIDLENNHSKGDTSDNIRNNAVCFRHFYILHIFFTKQ